MYDFKYLFLLGSLPTPQVYYLSLEFINEYGQNSVTVYWDELNKKVEQDVAAQLTYFKEKVFASYQLPNPIYIRAVRKGTNQSVLLNGQHVFPVVASEVEKPVQITLGERKLNLIQKAGADLEK